MTSMYALQQKNVDGSPFLFDQMIAFSLFFRKKAPFVPIFIEEEYSVQIYHYYSFSVLILSKSIWQPASINSYTCSKFPV